MTNLNAALLCGTIPSHSGWQILNRHASPGLSLTRFQDASGGSGPGPGNVASHDLLACQCSSLASPSGLSGDSESAQSVSRAVSAHLINFEARVVMARQRQLA